MDSGVILDLKDPSVAEFSHALQKATKRVSNQFRHRGQIRSQNRRVWTGVESLEYARRLE
jgi:hypothetical protein